MHSPMLKKVGHILVGCSIRPNLLLMRPWVSHCLRRAVCCIFLSCRLQTKRSWRRRTEGCERRSCVASATASRWRRCSCRVATWSHASGAPTPPTTASNADRRFSAPFERTFSDARTPLARSFSRSLPDARAPKPAVPQIRPGPARLRAETRPFVSQN